MIHVNDSNTQHEAAAPGRRGRRREVRAEAILDAAMAIVAGEGLDGLTLQRVARELDYVPAALYRYFASKDALLAALQRRAVTTLHQRFVATQAEAAAVIGRSVPAVRTLAAIVGAARFYLALPDRDPHAWRLVALLLGDPRRFISDQEAVRTAPLLLAFLADVAALFDAAVSAGGLSPGETRERTLVFWAALQGVAQLEKLRPLAPGSPSVTALGTVAVEALLAGWGAPRSGLRAATRLVERRS